MKHATRIPLSMKEATLMKNRLSPEVEPCFLGGPNDYQKTLFSESYNHLVIPSANLVKSCIAKGVGNGKCNVMEAPPGCGKTHAFMYDFLWRNLSLISKWRENSNMVAIFTSPDGAVNEAVVAGIQELIRYHKTDKTLKDILYKDYALDIHNVATKPAQLEGFGTEILVCTPKMATEYQVLKKKLSRKDTFLALIVSDEAHRGLGCPSHYEYKNDVGWSNQSYNATWFRGLRDLNAFVWIGLSGTPTKSQKSVNNKFYNVISDKMTKASFRNGFVDDLDMGSYPWKTIVEKVFLDITERNAISKYLFSFFTKANLGEKLYEDYKMSVKVTALLRSGQSGGKWATAEDVQKEWDSLVEKYKNTEFKFVKWNKETVVLKRNPGKCAICLDKNKTGGGTNGKVFEMMNDPIGAYDAVAVLYIGVVGINITNLGHIGIIPEVTNDGDVENSPVQLICRLARCFFVWPGTGWSIPVSKIKNPKIREIAIQFAINNSTNRVTSNESDLVRRAWNRFEKGHISLAGAYTYLSELVNKATNTLYEYSLAKEQDDIYKGYKVENPHCELCPRNEDGIPECEAAARRNHSEDSDEDFTKWLFGVLEVDHKDGNHYNNDKENLQTLCSDEHGYKTQKNEEFLQRYDENRNPIIVK